MQNLLYTTSFIILSFFSFFSPENKFEATDDEVPLSTNILNPPPECIGENGKLRVLYWNNLSGRNLSTLYDYIFYPLSPDGLYFTNDLEIPSYFNDNHGAIVRGFILAPETGDYLFNITGDDQTAFYLSTDDTPANMSLLVNTPDATGNNHIEHLVQTATATLVASSYYYFELHLKEGTGNDFAKVHWQLPSSTDGIWNLIHRSYLYDYSCTTICNPFGTPCDDGDASTTEDVEDGFCNCYGSPASTSNCVGEKGNVTALYYDGIAGNFIANLDDAALFPEYPTRAEALSDFRGPVNYGNDWNYYGTYVRAFLTVPVSGSYVFNITGNNEIKFWVSSSESTAPNDLVEVASIPDHTGKVEHDKYASQTSEIVDLVKGRYYYMELKMKEGNGDDHYAVHWKTPLDPAADWSIVNRSFLFQYTCETVCIPAQTACDDHDPTTINDYYDENCNCVGTPCGTPDCTGRETYVAYEVCNLTDKHSNQVDAWQSCETTPNPNTARETGHWIMYDLNELHQIHDTHIWNYNVANHTGKGLQDVVIDVSSDGARWTQMGTYSWPQASGLADYEGFVGPDYNGQAARYVLITALSNWNGDNCSGFSELKMNIEACPGVNTPCDDGDPNTLNDAYDELCVCKGVSDVTLALDLLSFDANWDNKNVLVGWAIQNEEAGTWYEVQRSLDAKNFEAIGILSGKAIDHQKTAYQLVDRNGYKLANELFYRLKMIESSNQEWFSHIVSLRQADGSDRLEINTIQPNPFTESVSIEFSIPSDRSKIQLKIFNGNGQFIRNLVNEEVNQGQYRMSWNGTDASGKEVESGIYYVQLTDGKQRIARRIVKL